MDCVRISIPAAPPGVVLLALLALAAPDQPCHAGEARVLESSALLEELAAAGPDVEAAPRREELLAAIESRGIEELRPVIESALETPDAVTRRACLEVLGVLGTGRDYDAALLAARAPATGEDAEPLVSELEDCLRAILVRQGRPSRSYFATLEAAPDALRVAFVRATSAVPSPAAVEGLVDLLDAHADLRAVLLTQVRRLLPEPMVWSAPEDVREGVRRFLASEDLQLVREAALTAGALGDEHAVERLVELLDRGPSGVASAALEALRAITGLDLPPAPTRWRAWLVSERAWLAERAPERVHTATRLSDQEAATASDRLRELAQHRLAVASLAREAHEALFHPEPRVRLVAVDALRQLDAPTSPLHLLDALEDPDEEVAGAAHRALVALLDRELPPERQAWRAALPDDVWLD